MAYDPPSQPPGDTTPEERKDEGSTEGSMPPPLPPSLAPQDVGGTSDTDMGSMAGTSDTGGTSDMGSMGNMGGGQTTPMSPLSSGDMPPAGGAMPPSGGYTPPPQPPAGGYAPPPPSGGYTPPPQPPQGGYGAPPPPPGMYGGPGTPANGGTGPAGMQHLLQSYINAVTKPNASTYEAEMGNASWVKVLVGVAVVAVVGFIVNLIFAGAMTATFDQIEQQLRSQGTNVDLTPYRAFVGGGGAVAALISPFITFFLGSLLLWLVARMFGGQGGDFMTHSYLLSLSYTPLRALASILAIVPCVNVIAGIVLPLYQLYCAGVSMQVSQRMAPGRAQMAAFLPTIVGIVLGCACGLLAIFGIAAAISGAGQ